MTRTRSLEPIDVAELRVGMFVQLDIGWMNHPFRTSNFVIGSDEQLVELQSLGLKQVRWNPSLSTPAAPVRNSGLQPPSPTEPPHASPRGELDLQRDRQAVCDQQFAEAAEASARIFDAVPSRPEQARRDAEKLASALVGKMIGDGEVCIRLLTDSAGDPFSRHAVNVGVLSLLLGQALHLPKDELLELGVGALLHDVGKIDLPPAARHFDAGMGSADASLYRSHVALGVAQARAMGLSRGASLVVAAHHERADGTGFPRGLAGDRMPVPARVVALVNRYDNLCNPGWPARAITPHDAVARLFALEKDAFDASLLASFVRLVGVYPPGSMVQLSDDRFAVVMGVNPQRPLKPRLLIHDPKRPACDALLTELERVPNLNIVRSLPAHVLPRSVRADLVPPQRLNYFWEPMASVSP